jgi:ankyrin repeat protein
MWIPQDGRVDPNSLNDGKTPLAKAIANGHLEVVKLLLADDRVVVDLSPNSAVYVAADKGFTRIIELLFQHQRANIHVTAGYAFAIHCRAGNTGLVRRMLSDVSTDPSHPFMLHWACKNSHVSVVRLLLADERVQAGISDSGPLRIACAAGCLAIVHMLLNHATVDPAADSNRALGIACEFGNAGVVKLLLADPRVDPSANDNESIVKAACYGGHVNIALRLLQDKRVDPSVRGDIVLQSACFLGFPQLVKLLLADPRVDPACRGDEPITSACRQGHLEVVKLLLADPRVDPTTHMNLPLRAACTHGCTAIVKLLFADPRVDPSAFDLSCALDRTLHSQHVDIVAILLNDPKIDPSADNNRLLRRVCSFPVLTVPNPPALQPHHEHEHGTEAMSLDIELLHKQELIVQLLLDDPRVDPGADEQAAVISASRRGSVGVLRLLLARLDSPVSTKALLAANGSNCGAAVELIIRVCPQVVWDLFVESTSTDLLTDRLAAARGPTSDEINGSLGDKGGTAAGLNIEGPLRDELDKWERRAAMTLLLAAKRTQSDVVAARVSDVFREVLEGFARF